jgi:hypothetical protein
MKLKSIHKQIILFVFLINGNQKYYSMRARSNSKSSSFNRSNVKIKSSSYQSAPKSKIQKQNQSQAYYQVATPKQIPQNPVPYADPVPVQKTGFLNTIINRIKNPWGATGIVGGVTAAVAVAYSLRSSKDDNGKENTSDENKSLNTVAFKDLGKQQLFIKNPKGEGDLEVKNPQDLTSGFNKLVRQIKPEATMEIIMEDNLLRNLSQNEDRDINIMTLNMNSSTNSGDTLSIQIAGQLKDMENEDWNQELIVQVVLGESEQFEIFRGSQLDFEAIKTGFIKFSETIVELSGNPISSYGDLMKKSNQEIQDITQYLLRFAAQRVTQCSEEIYKQQQEEEAQRLKQQQEEEAQRLQEEEAQRLIKKIDENVRLRLKTLQEEKKNKADDSEVYSFKGIGIQQLKDEKEKVKEIVKKIDARNNQYVSEKDLQEFFTDKSVQKKIEFQIENIESNTDEIEKYIPISTLSMEGTREDDKLKFTILRKLGAKDEDGYQDQTFKIQMGFSDDDSQAFEIFDNSHIKENQMEESFKDVSNMLWQEVQTLDTTKILQRKWLQETSDRSFRDLIYFGNSNIVKSLNNAILTIVIIRSLEVTVRNEDQRIRKEQEKEEENQRIKLAEEQKKRDEEELEIYNRVNLNALEIQKQLIFERDQYERSLKDCFDRLNNAGILTFENKDSLIDYHVNNLFGKDSVASLFGSSDKDNVYQNNVYQTIIGSIQSGTSTKIATAKKNIESLKGDFDDPKSQLGLHLRQTTMEDNLTDAVAYALTKDMRVNGSIKLSDSTIDGSNLLHSSEIIESEFKKYMEKNTEQYKSISLISDRVSITLGIYRKIFMELMNILTFSGYYSKLTGTNREILFENLINFKGKYEYKFEKKKELYDTEEGFQYRRNHLLNNVYKISQEEFEIWKKRYNQQNSQPQIIDSDFYSSISQKKSILELKLKQSINFFNTDQDTIIEAMVTAYNQKLRDLSLLEKDIARKQIPDIRELTEAEIKTNAQKIKATYLEYFQKVTPKTFMDKVTAYDFSKYHWNLTREFETISTREQTLIDYFHKISGYKFAYLKQKGWEDEQIFKKKDSVNYQDAELKQLKTKDYIDFYTTDSHSKSFIPIFEAMQTNNFNQFMMDSLSKT